jgi:XRE family transcriptional regulator, regulator of sulfur utilization
LTDLAVSTIPASLGGRLKAARLARSLSLGQVAAATEISRSFLSLVENGKSDITIGRLTRLIDYYGVSISDLVPTASPADPEVVRPAERRKLHSEVEGIDVLLLTPDTERTMMPMLVEFEPGAGLAEDGRHEGDEFIIVLSGELELELEGSEPRRLHTGDAAYYSAERPHRFRNASSRRRLRVLCVDTPPNL